MAMQIELKQLLIEERNRISEELHDRVSQHLFGIVYALHSLRNEWNEAEERRKLEQLLEIQEAAAAASRELRAAIYRFNSRQNDKTSWIGTVESHLALQAKLNGVRIRFHAPETDRRLPAGHRNALYRIISEGVGNAIRHGACSIVDVRLTLSADAVELTIVDNGLGFDAPPQQPERAEFGFGIPNMRTLALSLSGQFEIESRKGIGTRIRVRLPLAGVRKREGHKRKMG